LHSFRKDTGSPLANVLDWYSLDLLEEADVARLVREPVAYVQTSEAFIRRVFQLTGGHPYLTQYLLEEIGTDRSERRLDDVVQRFLALRRVFFDRIWEQLDRSARLTAAEIVDAGLRLPIKLLDVIVDKNRTDVLVDELCHNGIVRRQGDCVEIPSELFRHWYGQYGRLRLLPSSEQQVRNLLLDYLEPCLGRLCDARLATTRLLNCAGWKRLRNPGGTEKVFLGDYLQLLGDRLDLFSTDLRFLGEGKEVKRKLAEYATTLCPVRNYLCHPYGKSVTQEALAEAKLIAQKLITAIEPAVTN
jgi:hypothetical protein